jgi:hypothetical protein
VAGAVTARCGLVCVVPDVAGLLARVAVELVGGGAAATTSQSSRIFQLGASPGHASWNGCPQAAQTIPAISNVVRAMRIRRGFGQLHTAASRRPSVPVALAGGGTR